MARRLLHGLLAGVAASAAAAALWLCGALDGLEAAPWAWRVRALARPSPSASRIKLVLLDQESLDWGSREGGYPWPWPREVYTAILDFCRRGGARCVVFDFLFTEPSRDGVEDDERLGAAIRNTPGFVGAVYAGRGDAARWPQDVPDRQPACAGMPAWLQGRATAADVTAERAAFPVPELSQAAPMLGNVGDEPDADGVFRRAALFRMFDGRFLPSLGLAAYAAAERAAGREARFAVADGWFTADRARVPMDFRGRVIPRFAGPSGTYQAFKAAAVVQSALRLQAGETPELDPEVVRDCYVFFGPSAPGLLDVRPTPADRMMLGVEVHATVLDNLLEQSFLRDTPRGMALLSLLGLAMAAGLAVALGRRAWHSVAVCAAALPLPFGIGAAAYAGGYAWPVVAGEAAVAFALAGGIIVNYATEGRQKAFLKHAFRRYLGADVIEQLLADPSRLRLGGEKREMSLLFSDIEKFSAISEALDPAELTSLLNDFLTDVTDIILREGGYLDKYIGDAVVAFWNAPVAQPDHAVRACRAALRCQERLRERAAEFERRAGRPLRMRIGIHTGTVTVGNLGSRDRFNYTVLGDAANLASRLEGANKAFGTYCMISETTWSAAGSELQGRELGLLRVVGRQTPVRVFEPMAGPGGPPAWLSDYARGLEMCRAGRWTEALEAFEKCDHDPAAAVYAAQCRKLGGAGAQAWDGIWNLTEK